MIASVSEFRNLFIHRRRTTGETDIFNLLKHSQQAGLANIIATNGTLIMKKWPLN